MSTKPWIKCINLYEKKKQGILYVLSSDDKQSMPLHRFISPNNNSCEGQ